VGLVTGACLAELGNQVTCMDLDHAKIDDLKKGVIPIYEPGLEEIVVRNHKAGRLSFVTNLSQQEGQSEVYYVAVGTPSSSTGAADLQFVLSAVRMIGQHINEYCVVVDKSTVPVGVADKVQAAIQDELGARGVKVDFDVVSNPEFLKEGAAIEDFMKPDRLVVGYPTENAKNTMKKLYSPIIRNHGGKMLFMGVKDAEMSKYAVNAMLATRISFMNEMAVLCEKLGVDIENVRLGIGSDSRIGEKFLFPGCGYGGSCFPKDVKALVNTAKENGFDPIVLEAVEARNALQKQLLPEKISAFFGGDLTGKQIAVWGLSFKAGTDDMREASSIVLLESLIRRGATVRAYDPVAMKVAENELPKEWFESGKLSMADSQYHALEKADALVLVTEWQPFLYPDIAAMKKTMNQRVIFDGRNIYDPVQMEKEGFIYSGIGRGLSMDALVSYLVKDEA
jgi:UDPglucose 6-dehydrogenase